MHLLRLLSLGLWACFSPQNYETGSKSTDTGEDSDTTQEQGIFGSVPASPLSAPEFSATNRDGSNRNREHLMGHPTVFWFFPSAGTYG